MRVADLMTVDPIVMNADDSWASAVHVMDERGLRHLPVFDGLTLLGVVSDRDLLEATDWKPAWALDAHPLSNEQALGQRKLRALVRAPAVTLSPEDSIVSAALEMSLRRIGCLPVLDDFEGRPALVGILTELDLVRGYVQACASGRIAGAVDLPVARRMTRSVRCVTPDTHAREALAIARSIGVRHLPVLAHNQVVGMLSDRDLRHACGRPEGGDPPVASIMSRELKSVAPTDALSIAAALMARHKISSLPVLEGQRLAGILSLTDVLDHCLESLREPEPARGPRS